MRGTANTTWVHVSPATRTRIATCDSSTRQYECETSQINTADSGSLADGEELSCCFDDIPAHRAAFWQGEAISWAQFFHGAVLQVGDVYLAAQDHDHLCVG